MLAAPKIQKVCPMPKISIKLANEVVTRKAKLQAKKPIKGPQNAFMGAGEISLTTSHGTPPCDEYFNLCLHFLIEINAHRSQ
jgi:hypothetical protein